MAFLFMGYSMGNSIRIKYHCKEAFVQFILPLKVVEQYDTA